MAEVALRKESVDRNMGAAVTIAAAILSLSARRAWIEIMHFSVPFPGAGGSLSARRVWIEIGGTRTAACGWMSLSARRAWIEICQIKKHRHGGRSLSARRAWIEMLLP